MNREVNQKNQNVKRVKYTAFLVLSYGSKTSLSHGGFRGFRL